MLQGGIFALAMTNDNEYLFISNSIGYIVMWSVLEKRIVNNFGKSHSSMICDMAVTSDNIFLISRDVESNLKQWKIKDQKLVNSFGEMTNGPIIKMIL